MDYKVDKRINYVPLTEPHVVSTDYPYMFNLREIPDIAGTITISGMVRVNSMPINPTDFYVNRTGSVFFHASKKGLPYTVSYYGGGSVLLAGDWNQMVDAFTSTNNLIMGLKSLIFGDIKLNVVPGAVNTPVTNLNTASSGSFKLTFNVSLVNSANQVYTWLNDIPMYVTMNSVFVDTDILPPVITPAPSTLKFTGGVCSFTATYSTDFGAYKKYTSGDYVNYTISTVDPTTNVGINLVKVVSHAIQ